VLDPAEVAFWLEEFANPPSDAPDSTGNASNSSRSPNEFANPFPPGYGEDLLDDLGA
jgi:hypothetical protein